MLTSCIYAKKSCTHALMLHQVWNHVSEQLSTQCSIRTVMVIGDEEVPFLHHGGCRPRGGKTPCGKHRCGRHAREQETVAHVSAYIMHTQFGVTSTNALLTLACTHSFLPCALTHRLSIVILPSIVHLCTVPHLAVLFQSMAAYCRWSVQWHCSHTTFLSRRLQHPHSDDDLAIPMPPLCRACVTPVSSPCHPPPT